MLVISPLTSVIQDQIAEARSLGIKCVSLLEVKKEFRSNLKDSSSLLLKNICGIVVDESYTVETWTGKRFAPIVFILLSGKAM